MKQNNRNSLLAALVMAGMLPSLVLAQEEGQAKAMSLRECMEYAVSNSTKMRIEAADR